MGESNYGALAAVTSKGSYDLMSIHSLHKPYEIGAMSFIHSEYENP